MKNKFIVLTLIGAVLLSLINISLLYLFVPGPLKETKTIIVPSGLSTRQIASVLYEAEAISYPKVFGLISKFYSIKDPLKSGEYLLTSGVSPLQILNILSSGKSIVHKLVIPEGVMVSEIIEKVNAAEVLFGDIKGIIPEGYLLPETYYYSYGDQREQLIDQMRNRMSRALDEVMPKLSPDSPLKSRMDVLTLASIVEKETALDEERTLIAAVFLNRLKRDMKLQADPTTIYAVTEGKLKLNRPLTKEDLSLASKYNTYYVKGLPVTPIACPGRKSLEAVVAPAKTDALYFVVNGKGGHNFSVTLDEHNRHVRKYRSITKNLSK